jgi:hypothetical protein
MFAPIVPEGKGWRRILRTLGRPFFGHRTATARPTQAPLLPATPAVPPLPAPLPLGPRDRRAHRIPLAQPEAPLPPFVAECAVARKYLALLGPLDWAHFPERSTRRAWPGPQPAPRAPYLAAYLVKLQEGLRSMGHLRTYLVEHPALAWLLGFPLRPDPTAPAGFDVEHSLPSRRQFGPVLRELDPAAAQFLLDASVQRIAQALPAELPFADIVSGDTKHIVAWVQENNPKAYVSSRYDKHQQPRGDPDCKLGCKRRRNQGEGDRDPLTRPEAAPGAAHPDRALVDAGGVPSPQPTRTRPARKGEFYWGYGSGVIVTKVPDGGEFVLAELTQPFDQNDVTYFVPLLQQVERRLGHRPRFGAFDAAFDAFYVYEYFHQAGGFAAVPLVAKGGCKTRTFSPDGLPLCAAGLPMPLKFPFTDRTTTGVVHQRGKYVCPLVFPQTHADAAGCPIQHPNWAQGGCTAMMPTSPGARIRYQLDRESAEFKHVYQQRTADERINSQAVELGIERPRLRRRSAITHQNTLIYVLINLRALQRVRTYQEERARQRSTPHAPDV